MPPSDTPARAGVSQRRGRGVTSRTTPDVVDLTSASSRCVTGTHFRRRACWYRSMTGPRATDSPLALPLTELLERVAAPTPAPGGGSSAGVTCALAAALVEMAAGFETGARAGERGAAAAQLRARALELAEQDLTSYEPVLQALRRPADDADRPARLTAALRAAAAAPLGSAPAAPLRHRAARRPGGVAGPRRHRYRRPAPARRQRHGRGPGRARVPGGGAAG